MKSERIHDALNHLDDDMVEAVGNLRKQRTGGAGMWVRWGALAACLCVVVLGAVLALRLLPDGGAGTPGEGTQVTPEVTPAVTGDLQGGEESTMLYQESQNPEFSVPGSSQDPDSYTLSGQSLRTNGGFDGQMETVVTVIRSRQELADYYERFKGTYNFSGFQELSEKYDDAYFSQQVLILVRIFAGSGSIRYEPVDIHWEDDQWVVTLKREVPEAGTADMACWHLFLEPSDKVTIAPEDAVAVSFAESSRFPQKIGE